MYLGELKKKGAEAIDSLAQITFMYLLIICGNKYSVNSNCLIVKLFQVETNIVRPIIRPK